LKITGGSELRRPIPSMKGGLKENSKKDRLCRRDSIRRGAGAASRRGVGICSLRSVENPERGGSRKKSGSKKKDTKKNFKTSVEQGRTRKEKCRKTWKKKDDKVELNGSVFRAPAPGKGKREGGSHSREGSSSRLAPHV